MSEWVAARSTGASRWPRAVGMRREHFQNFGVGEMATFRHDGPSKQLAESGVDFVRLGLREIGHRFLYFPRNVRPSSRGSPLQPGGYRRGDRRICVRQTSPTSVHGTPPVSSC